MQKVTGCKQPDGSIGDQFVTILFNMSYVVIAGIYLSLSRTTRRFSLHQRVTWVPPVLICASFIANDIVLMRFGESSSAASRFEWAPTLWCIFAICLFLLEKRCHELGGQSFQICAPLCTMIASMLLILLYEFSSIALGVRSSRSKLAFGLVHPTTLKLSSFNQWSHLAASQVALYGTLACKDNLHEVLSNMSLALFSFAITIAAGLIILRHPADTLTARICVASVLYSAALLCQLRIMVFIGKSLLHSFKPVGRDVADSDVVLSSKRVGFAICGLVLMGWMVLPACSIATELGLIYRPELVNKVLICAAVFENAFVPLVVVHSAMLWRVRVEKVRMRRNLDGNRKVVSMLERLPKSVNSDLAAIFQVSVTHPLACQLASYVPALQQRYSCYSIDKTLSDLDRRRLPAALRRQSTSFTSLMVTIFQPGSNMGPRCAPMPTFRPLLGGQQFLCATAPLYQ